MPEISRAIGVEVCGYAKVRCRLCTGQGVMYRRYAPKQGPLATICGCVVNWLLKHKGKEVEYDSKGQLYWREGFSPKDLMFNRLMEQRERRLHELELTGTDKPGDAVEPVDQHIDGGVHVHASDGDDRDPVPPTGSVHPA